MGRGGERKGGGRGYGVGFYPSYKDVSMTVLKLINLKSTQTNLYTCNFKPLKAERY